MSVPILTLEWTPVTLNLKERKHLVGLIDIVLLNLTSISQDPLRESRQSQDDQTEQQQQQQQQPFVPYVVGQVQLLRRYDNAPITTVNLTNIDVSRNRITELTDLTSSNPILLQGTGAYYSTTSNQPTMLLMRYKHDVSDGGGGLYSADDDDDGCVIL